MPRTIDDLELSDRELQLSAFTNEVLDHLCELGDKDGLNGTVHELSIVLVAILAVCEKQAGVNISAICASATDSKPLIQEGAIH